MYKFVWILFIAVMGTSCSSTYFNTANDLKKVNGVVIKKDGTEVLGDVSFRSFGGSQSAVTIVPSGSNEKLRIPLTDIGRMEIRGVDYVPGRIDDGGARLVFLKPISRPDSKLKLYEYYEQERRTDRNYRGDTYTRKEDKFSYYLEVPGHRLQETLWDLSGRRLVPNFDEKMSAVVKDCPALAEKIRNKDKGYFYAQISARDRVEVMQRIINEYNRCE